MSSSRTTSPTRTAQPGRADHERHANAFVDEDAVVTLAVIAERLAVIAGDDDDRAIQKAALLERVEQPADLRVGEHDLADVEIVMIAIGTARAGRTADAGRRGAPTGKTGSA